MAAVKSDWCVDGSEWMGLRLAKGRVAGIAKDGGYLRRKHANTLMA